MNVQLSLLGLALQIFVGHAGNKGVEVSRSPPLCGVATIIAVHPLVCTQGQTL